MFSDLQFNQKHLVIFCLNLLFMYNLNRKINIYTYIIQHLKQTYSTLDGYFLIWAYTFLTGGLTITSSKLSSDFTVWKFSWSMAIFFSLSQPDGLAERSEGGLQTKYRWCYSPWDMYIHLHEDSISFHHLCKAVEGKAVESVDQIFVQNVQVLHLLHWCVNQRGTV